MECYYPNGQSGGEGLQPCNSTAAVTHCCRQGDICISNGLCFSAGLNALVRRGCTDRTWNSTECPQECTKGQNYNSADVVLTPCDTYTTFCCGQDEAARNCCNTSNGTVRIPAGSAIIPNANTVTLSSTVTVGDTCTASSPAGSLATSVSAAPAINCQQQQNATIGVGVALGVATLVAALASLFFYYQRRQANLRVQEAEQRYQELLRQRETFEF